MVHASASSVTIKRQFFFCPLSIMDNLTHSLVGCAVAESVFHRLPGARKPSLSSKLRAAFWVVALLGNNFPDLDFLYSGWTLSNPRLGHLLHHRGHTHTILIALGIGALLGALGHWVLSRRLHKMARADYFGFWAVAVSGPVLHILLDSLNNYGVHPYWPFSNAWVYGDTLFIIEPLLWVALAPVVYFASEKRRVRWVTETLFVAVFTVLWIFPLTRWYSNVAVLLLAASLWLVCLRAKPVWRSDISLGVSWAIVIVFASVSHLARQRVVNDNAELFPSSTLHDVILSPFPANPFCWNVITVETYSGGDKYRLRRGRYAPFPRWVSAEQCPLPPTRGSTAYLSSVPALWGPDYDWEGQYQATLSDLRGFTEYSCSWKAFLQFSRAPFLQEEGGSLWAGDLRYDYGPELGFAEIEIPEQKGPCLGWLPPWGAPERAIASAPTDPQTNTR
jgi:inner membrane protein